MNHELNKVSVVILNYNGLKLMQKYLPTVIENSRGAEVIVADNGSTDGSVEWLRNEHPELRLIAFEKNFGFAEGYNQALKLVDNEYYVLLNSDVRTPEGWLQPLFDYMETHSECAACQPKIRAELEPEKFEYAGAAGGFMDIYGYPLFKDDIAAFCERKLPFIVWNNIYRRSSLINNKITWDVNLKSLQDAQFNLQCLLSGMRYEYSVSPADYAYRYGVAGSVSKKINTAEHLKSNLYTIGYFYNEVQQKFSHKYDFSLYKGTVQILLSILRNDAPKWFTKQLVATVINKSPIWGFILQIQVLIYNLLINFLLFVINI